jgi:hypothetical protein
VQTGLRIWKASLQIIKAGLQIMREGLWILKLYACKLYLRQERVN